MSCTRTPVESSARLRLPQHLRVVGERVVGLAGQPHVDGADADVVVARARRDVGHLRRRAAQHRQVGKGKFLLHAVRSPRMVAARRRAPAALHPPGPWPRPLPVAAAAPGPRRCQPPVLTWCTFLPGE